MLIVIMLGAIMLNVANNLFVLSIVMLNVVMLSVVAPCFEYGPRGECYKTFYGCKLGIFAIS